MQRWPAERSKVHEAIRPYHAFRVEIVYCNGLLFRGNRLAVPKTIQAKMLSCTQESHEGTVKCKQRTRNILFWPGMNSQIEDIISQCAQFRKAQLAEPLISHEILNRAWSKIATDLYHLNGPQYLILVEYYSKLPEVVPLNGTKTGPVMAAMKSIFARQGIPRSYLITAHHLIVLHLQALQGTANFSTLQGVLVFHNPTDRLRVAFRQSKGF